jgi:hypothetical protein
LSTLARVAGTNREPVNGIRAGFPAGKRIIIGDQNFCMITTNMVACIKRFWQAIGNSGIRSGLGRMWINGCNKCVQ